MCCNSQLSIAQQAIGNCKLPIGSCPLATAKRQLPTGNGQLAYWTEGSKILDWAGPDQLDRHYGLDRTGRTRLGYSCLHCKGGKRTGGSRERAAVRSKRVRSERRGTQTLLLQRLGCCSLGANKFTRERRGTQRLPMYGGGVP